MNKQTRNSEIEFLRFLFATLILFYHARKFIPDVSCFAKHGYFGVEFFFILSGTLMAKSICRNHQHNIHVKTTDFIKKEIMHIFPYHLISFIGSFIVVLIINNIDSLTRVIKLFISCIPELLLIFPLSGFQYDLANINAMEWYISAMLLGMLILYPLINNHYEKFVYNIAPIIVIFGFGFIFANNEQNLNCLYEWNGYICLGLLRALTELSLGTLCYEISRRLLDTDFTQLGKCLLYIVKIISFLIIIIYICSNLSKYYEFIFVYLIALIIALTFGGITIDNFISNKSIFYCLGKLSLPLYLWQGCIRKYIIYKDFNFTFIGGEIVYFLVILFLSIITSLVVSLFNKYDIFHKIKKMLIVDKNKDINFSIRN